MSEAKDPREDRVALETCRLRQDPFRFLITLAHGNTFRDLSAFPNIVFIKIVLLRNNHYFYSRAHYLDKMFSS